MRLAKRVQGLRVYGIDLKLHVRRGIRRNARAGGGRRSVEDRQINSCGRYSHTTGLICRSFLCGGLLPQGPQKTSIDSS